MHAVIVEIWFNGLGRNQQTEDGEPHQVAIQRGLEDVELAEEAASERETVRAAP